MSYSLYKCYEEREIYGPCYARPVLEVCVRYVRCGALDHALRNHGGHVQF
jgi:hypothetical protein